MILEDLPMREYYGQILQLSLVDLIRPEAYFPSFATFISAMENDVFVAKQRSLLHKQAAL